MSVLNKLWLELRYLQARQKRGTVRFKTRNLPEFYKQMQAANIAYVVLRWADDVPLDPKAEASTSHDVDHLIEDGSIRKILALASRFPGKVKCDYYSVSGRSGTCYRGMPYYMPSLASRILANRVLDPRGFYRPSPADEFHAFAYHLCYHKGHRAGLATGLDGAEPDPVPTRDYLAGLQALAKAAGLTLPDDVTLMSLHVMLVDAGWGMAYDLMLRWPDQHPFLKALQTHLETDLKAEVKAAKDLTIFVLRDDCDTEELEDIARQRISERFEIIQEIRLDALGQARVMSQTRGGNWNEKSTNGPVAPTLAFLCRNAPEPGPLPVKMSPEKLARRYPQLTNTDALIKRPIRDEINAAGGARHRVAIHATDNPGEAVETLHAVLGDQAKDFLRDFAAHP